MDSISLLGPPQPSKPLNQDDFDTKYNYVRFRKKKTNGDLFKMLLVGDSWAYYNPCSNMLPIINWLPKYRIKENLLKDLAGAILLSLLYLPQAIGTGVLVGDVPTAIFSIFLPQVLYCILGSGRHSSIGSLSYTSMLVYSTIHHSQSEIGTISFLCGVFQLLQFLLPLEFIYAYINSPLLSGFSTGLFFRVVIRFIPQFISFEGHDCEKIMNKPIGTTHMTETTPIHVKKVLQCFYATVPCLRTDSILLISVTVIAGIILLVFKIRLNSIIQQKVGVSVPYEFAVLLMVMISTHFGQSVKPEEELQPLKLPSAKLFGIPSMGSFLDAFSISLFSIASHFKIAKSIAYEKMYKVNRKQEILCFSIISLVASIFGLLPPSSSYGSSPINVESSKYSMISNVLAIIPLSLMIYFGQDFLASVPLCTVGVMVVLCYCGWISDLNTMRELWSSSTWDGALSFMSMLCALVFPNTCHGFLFAIFLSIFSVALRVQWPNYPIMVKLYENQFGEEKRYEGDCLDTPVRIIRLCGPVISANAENLRNEVQKQAAVVKGLIGIGIGTRTASLRSQCPSAFTNPRESVAARSSNGLTNIVITQDCDLPMPPLTEGPQTLRFIILDFCGVNAVDKDSLQSLSQIYGDLNNEHIKLMFAGVGASVRDAMDLLRFHNTVPKVAFYPNLQEAIISARNMVLPFHMSVSMNGYRDIIALSCTGSNVDLNRATPEAV